jgi:hypothetical protein
MFKLTGLLVKFYTTSVALTSMSKDATQAFQERENVLMYVEPYEILRSRRFIYLFLYLVFLLFI